MSFYNYDSRFLVEAMDSVVRFAAEDHEDVEMVNSMNQMAEMPCFKIEIGNYRIRQFLAREIFKRYQFNCLKVEFNKESPEFIVRKT